METSERLKICSNCRNRAFDKEKGLVCGIDGQVPFFESVCDYLIPEKNPVRIHKPGSNLLQDTGELLSTRSTRLGNFVLDSLLIFLFDFLIKYSAYNNDFFVVFEINTYLSAALMVMIYYTFFETLFSQTPGKMVTRCKVVTELGEKPMFMSILIRSFARLIPFEAFSFFTASGWHDRLSETRVVSTKYKNIIVNTAIIDDMREPGELL